MRIAVATDHAGFPLKQPIIDELRQLGHDMLDLGTNSEAPVDYPDYAEAAGNAVSQWARRPRGTDLRQRRRRVRRGE